MGASKIAKKLVSVRVIRMHDRYNVGDVAGFTPEEARRRVSMRLSVYREAADVPEGFVEPDEVPDIAVEDDGDTEPGGESEPAPSAIEPGVATPLPSAWPDKLRAALLAAGIEHVEAVPLDQAALLAIEGIGAGFARRILTDLGA
jgi:hypothetical protein